MIGKLLGHTQVQTTARYAHLAAEPVKAAATKIAETLAAAMGKRLPISDSATKDTNLSQEVADAVAVELAAYRRAMRVIVEDPEINGGAPTFRNTRLLVCPIADLLRKGVSVGDLREDFPRLTNEMAEAALVFSRAHAA